MKVAAIGIDKSHLLVEFEGGIRERVLRKKVSVSLYDYSNSETLLYLIYNEFGLFCAVFAPNIQEALDQAMDDGFLDNEIITDPVDLAEYEANDEVMYLGGAGVPVLNMNVGVHYVKNNEIPSGLKALAKRAAKTRNTL